MSVTAGTERGTHETQPPTARFGGRAWAAVGALLALLSLESVYRDVGSRPLDRFVPSPPAVAAVHAHGTADADIMMSDLRFNVWGISHGARSALTPWKAFEALPCHPEQRALAYGHPLLTLGGLGAPVYWLTGDPVATYNGVLLAMPLLAVLAMSALVWDWTRRPAAAIAAGLLYGLLPAKLAFVQWPFITDTVWAVWALFFGRRFFARGRLRDGMLTSLACTLQFGVSFYPVLATAFLAPVFGAWLVAGYRFRALRPAPALASLALLLLGGTFVYAPYLSVRWEHDTLSSASQAFAPWSYFAPQGSIDGLVIGLALAALFLAPRSALARFPLQPRWFVLTGLVLVAWLATDGSAAADYAARQRGEEPGIGLPGLYSAVSRWIPGLDSIRLPLHTAGGFHLGMCLLAGLGAAEILERVPGRARNAVALLLVAWVFVDGVRPRSLGLEPRVVYGASEVAPDREAIRFFQDLDAMGNTGPLLEVPINRRRIGYVVADSSRQTLLTSYHGRRTSGCYNSYIPDSQTELREISRGLPSPEAVARARSLGFTTLVVHEPPDARSPRSFGGRIRRAARTGRAPLRPIHADANRTAYAIDPIE